MSNCRAGNWSKARKAHRLQNLRRHTLSPSPVKLAKQWIPSLITFSTMQRTGKWDGEPRLALWQALKQELKTPSQSTGLRTETKHKGHQGSGDTSCQERWTRLAALCLKTALAEEEEWGKQAKNVASWEGWPLGFEESYVTSEAWKESSIWIHGCWHGDPVHTALVLLKPC